MSQKTAYILADGSKCIGMGHLSRACLLANFIKAFSQLRVKIMMKRDAHAEQFVLNRKIETMQLPSTNSSCANIKDLTQQFMESTPPLFILDVLEPENYQEFLEQLQSWGCLTVVVFDKSEKTSIKADIVVNGNPHQLDYDYSYSPGRYLVGPQFFIMDPAYGDIEVEPPDGSINNVLLTVGGADQNGLLFRILDAINRINTKAHFKIITSKASGYWEQLQTYLAELSFSKELLVDIPSLAPLWNTCDVAITAGGNTLFERIATRIPGGTVCQLDRQMEIANYFEKMGVNINWGLGVDLNEEQLMERIEAFFNNSAEQRSQYANAPNVTEGRGLYYLIQAIIDL